MSGDSTAKIEMLISEKDFLKTIIDYAHLRGWSIAHFRTSMTQSGRWATAVQADGAGFPDLVIVREKVIYAEVKANKGRLSPDQVEWRERLLGAHQTYYCWMPSDWDFIVELLR